MATVEAWGSGCLQKKIPPAKATRKRVPEINILPGVTRIESNIDFLNLEWICVDGYDQEMTQLRGVFLLVLCLSTSVLGQELLPPAMADQMLDYIRKEEKWDQKYDTHLARMKGVLRKMPESFWNDYFGIVKVNELYAGLKERYRTQLTKREAGVVISVYQGSAQRGNPAFKKFLQITRTFQQEENKKLWDETEERDDKSFLKLEKEK